MKSISYTQLNLIKFIKFNDYIICIELHNIAHQAVNPLRLLVACEIDGHGVIGAARIDRLPRLLAQGVGVQYRTKES